MSLKSLNNFTLKPQQGLSLLEVLVALTILAFGVLGNAVLQLTAVNASQLNNHFIQASLITNNLANRMMLNKQAIFELGALKATSNYLNTSSYGLSVLGYCQTSYYQCFCQQKPAQITSCRQEEQGTFLPCNSEQLEQFDTYEIACQLALLSNSTIVKIYPYQVDQNTVLFNINLLWPEQSVHVNDSSNTNNNNDFLSMTHDGCQRAITEVTATNNRIMCYSQSFIFTVNS